MYARWNKTITVADFIVWNYTELKFENEHILLSHLFGHDHDGIFVVSPTFLNHGIALAVTFLHIDGEWYGNFINRIATNAVPTFSHKNGTKDLFY